MACRTDRSVHVLFRKECARPECRKVFDHCGCEPGRQYCGDKCSVEARAESVREARATYSARNTEEGRAAHAAEEAARRERRSRERLGPGKEHDQAHGGPGADISLEASDAVRSPAAGIKICASPELGVATAATAWMPEPAKPVVSSGAVERPVASVGDQRCSGQPDVIQRPSLTAPFAVTEASNAPVTSPLPFTQSSLPARVEPEFLAWVLVVPPELRRAARRQEGAVASCPFCGRRGRIRRVVSTEQWRRWIRRHLNSPP